MPLVIALPKSSRPSAAAMPSPRPSQISSAASSRRSVSRRSVRSRASQSTRTTATRSTAPSSASISPARSKPETRQNTNITIRHRGQKGIGITVDDRTGAFANYSDESEEDSGLKFHSSQDDDEFTSEEEEDDDDEEDDEWDYIEDDIQPSDSASRPHHARGQQSHRHVVPPAPPAPSVPVTQRPRQSRRTSPRHAVAAPDPHSAQHSRSRSRGSELAREHRPRRPRRRSIHQPDSLEEDTGDDYPYAGPPQPQGIPPGHPSQQWSHVPPAHGYAPSTMSHHGFYPGGAASPTGQLVPNGYHGYDHYSHGNGFNPQQPNPFSPGPIGVERDGYFGGQGHGQPQGPRAGNPNRRSVGGPSSDAMTSYGQMGGHPGFQGYPPYPYGGMQGMPQAPYPGHFSQHSSPPPPEERHHSRSKRGTPRPRSVHHDYSDEDHHHHQQVVQAPRHSVTIPPPPPATMPMVQVIPATQPMPAPPDTAKEDAMLKKLNDLLSGKAEEEAKKEAEERKAAELAKFARLENLLIAQQEAQIAKEKRKQQDAENAAAAAAEAKKKGDEDKLANLEKLILAQKDEQLKREAAAEAARKAAADAADAEAKKIAEEKKAAAEAAALLLEAAKKAREEAEKKAAAEAEETKKAHEKALAEAKAAAEELEKAKKAAEEEAAKLKPSDAPKAPIKFKDAVGRKFSFPWHPWKVCRFANLIALPFANSSIGYGRAYQASFPARRHHRPPRPSRSL